MVGVARLCRNKCVIADLLTALIKNPMKWDGRGFLSYIGFGIAIGKFVVC